MDNITFTISNSDPTIPLGVECWIDKEKISDIESVTVTDVVIEIPVKDDKHELQIILKNKLPEHTVIDATDKIVKDAVLNLTNFNIDGISLDQLLYEHAEYTHDFNGTQHLQTEKFYGTLGCNGTLSFKFSTPIHLWLLEHM